MSDDEIDLARRRLEWSGVRAFELAHSFFHSLTHSLTHACISARDGNTCGWTVDVDDGRVGWGSTNPTTKRR